MGFPNLWYATICVPVFAESEEEAMTKSQALAASVAAEYLPTELAFSVESLEEDIKLNP